MGSLLNVRSSHSSSLQHVAPKTPSKIHIIGGQWKRTPLPVLSLPGLRPTTNRVRETVFNWLGNRLDGWRCLDLFAGSGALGFEAASRGAAHVLMVEKDTRAIKQLRANQQKLQAEMIHIVQGDALQFAARLPADSLDIIFLDPPFATTDTSNSTPSTDKILVDAIRYAWKAIRPGGLIYIESPVEIKEATWMALLEDNCPLTHYKAFGAVHAHLLRR